MNSFNKFVLRRLFNKGNVGRGEQGVIRRKEFKITLTPETYLALSNLIEVGPGQYGSPVMEMSLRMMLATMGVFSEKEFAKVCEQLVLGISDRSQFADNLVRLAESVKTFELVS